MPRPTRAETQSRTRTTLLEVARELFLRDGYAGTSLERVAESAGFSKGAVYSNFRNKDALCLAVLDDISEREISTMLREVAVAEGWEDRLAVLREWSQRRLGDEGWTLLEVEVALQARYNAALRERLAERDRAVREGLVAVLRGLAEEAGSDYPLPVEDVATALLSLGIGLGLRRTVAPELPTTVLPDLLRLLTPG